MEERRPNKMERGIKGGEGWKRREWAKERVNKGRRRACGDTVVKSTCNNKKEPEKKEAHPLLLGDNLTIRRYTALICSENKMRTRINHRAREEQEEGRGRRTPGRLDRWYNLERKRGRESYEFKN